MVVIQFVHNNGMNKSTNSRDGASCQCNKSFHKAPLKPSKFILINDLFSSSSCRLYQVRCSLKVSPGKLPIQIETCIPDQNANNQTTGPCIINGAGVSKVFQILYRNEEVSLRDVIMFRAHLLGNLKCCVNIFAVLNDALNGVA